MYFITATTKSDGMGLAVVTVHNGDVYGNTNIVIEKDDDIYSWEADKDTIGEQTTREDALKHKDKIMEHKRNYDQQSDKKKKQFSESYLDWLNRMLELIGGVIYEGYGGEIEDGGLMLEEDEVGEDSSVKLELNVTQIEGTNVGEEGITTEKEYIQQSIEDAAGDSTIAGYYDITLSKDVKGEKKDIHDVERDADSTGEVTVTIPIPEKDKGHKHYNMVHEHNGNVETLTDIDNNPNTVTIKTKKFSTFAMTYTDTELTEVDTDVTAAAIVSVGSVETLDNKTITVDVALADCAGFADLALEIGYDANVLTLTEVTDVLGQGEFTVSETLGVNPYLLWWTNDSNVSYNGTVATLTFTVAEGAPAGNYPITVSHYKGPKGTYIDGDDCNYDENYVALNLDYVDGNVEVLAYIPGDINADESVNNKDATTILRYLAGWMINIIETKVLDVNGDGSVNNKDATALLRYLAGWGVDIY